MSTTQTLLKTYEFNRGRTLDLLSTIEKMPNPQAVLAWRPGPGRAHIGWQLMHVGITEEIFATERLAPEKPAAFVELWPRFRGGSTPDDDVPSAETIRRILGETRAHLGVNIDHVATLRQARRTNEPDPVWAAALAELGGADGITLHLREDRRHIQDRDLEILRKTVTVKLNLELAANSAVIEIACRIRPDQATLVPERREEVTTEGGLDVAGNRAATADAIRRLRDAGIVVSLFLDPDQRQIEAARELAAGAVELHTGRYANAATDVQRAAELASLA